MVTEITAVKEIIKANTTALYTDSVQPSIRVVGKSLAQCVSLFATPVGRTAEIFEKNIHNYLNKLDGQKEGELIPPETRILVPILEKMRYTEDETVANYYAEILATATKKETRGKVLLSFIEILNRVTSDELKILEFINSSDNQIIIDGTTITEKERSKYDIPNDQVNVPLGNAVPIIDVRIETKGKQGYLLILNNFNTLSENIIFDFPENIDFYLDNLVSLGLLHIPHNASYAADPIYKHLTEHSDIKKRKDGLVDGQKITFSYSRIDLTSLSLRLLSLCQAKK